MKSGDDEIVLEMVFLLHASIFEMNNVLVLKTNHGWCKLLET